MNLADRLAAARESRGAGDLAPEDLAEAYEQSASGAGSAEPVSPLASAVAAAEAAAGGGKRRADLPAAVGATTGGSAQPGSVPRSSATTSPTPGPTSLARSSAPCWRPPSTGSSSSRAAAPSRRWRTPSLRGARPRRRARLRRCGSRAAPAGLRPPHRPAASPGASGTRPLAVGAKGEARDATARVGATRLVMCVAAAGGRDLMPKGSLSLG